LAAASKPPKRDVEALDYYNRAVAENNALVSVFDPPALPSVKSIAFATLQPAAPKHPIPRN
jgi:hypothetical protein